MPRGVILLDSITSIRALPPQNRRKRKDEDVEMSDATSLVMLGNTTIFSK